MRTLTVYLQILVGRPLLLNCELWALIRHRSQGALHYVHTLCDEKIKEDAQFENEA